MIATSASDMSSSEPLQERRFTLWQRFVLAAITWAGFLAIRLIGPTLRYSVSLEEGAPEGIAVRPIVHSFWHRCVFPATYLCRHLNIRVMTSRSFDGEYIARIIRKFGFVPVRGSSSRGGARALLAMRREVEQGWTAAFTIDGPRGPALMAKPGPVLLARASGAPMSAFYIAVDRSWVLNTWDRFVVPKPFARALMRMARQEIVPESSDEVTMEQFQQGLQASLERVTEFAEKNVARVGSLEFPIYRRRA